MPAPRPAPIVVAGHICLDLIPALATGAASYGDLLTPGTLVDVGPAVISTGGSVANTGLALHLLGDAVRLVGKVGKDGFGDVLLEVLRQRAPRLAESMVVDPRSHTSYTVVLSPPGLDRVFLHHPGANDTFGASDLTDAHLDGAAILHLGYPPLMRRFYSDGGEELATLLQHAHGAGVVTSLDLAYPDPASDAGRVDWRALLARVLPLVDVFLPSLDELAFMLKHDARVTRAGLDALADDALALGAGVVGLKCGDAGLFLKTASDAARLASLVRVGARPRDWAGRAFYAPCFEANFVGATGSGDCTIAGFLSELARGGSPEDCLVFATAVGACSVEAADATGGIRPRAEVERRLAAGWNRHAVPDGLEDLVINHLSIRGGS